MCRARPVPKAFGIGRELNFYPPISRWGISKILKDKEYKP